MSAQDFISEFNSETTDLEGFSQYRNWKDKVGIHLQLDEDEPNAVYMNGFFTLHATGTGAGTEAVKHLQELAKKHQASLMVYAISLSPAFANEQLALWYLDRGFVEDGFEDIDLGGTPMEVARMKHTPPSQ